MLFSVNSDISRRIQGLKIEIKYSIIQNIGKSPKGGFTFRAFFVPYMNNKTILRAAITAIMATFTFNYCMLF